jgi:hypothetical protein
LGEDNSSLSSQAGYHPLPCGIGFLLHRGAPLLIKKNQAKVKIKNR